MTIPVKIKYRIEGGGYQTFGNFYSLFVQPADPIYVNIAGAMQDFAIYINSPADIPNGIFLTLQDALDYYLSGAASVVVASINTGLSSSDYVVGDIYQYDLNTNFILNTSEMLGKDSSGNFMGVTVAAAGMAVMGCAAFQDIKNSLATAISDVSGLTSALSGKASLVHTHAASDITAGTFADARVAQSNVTQYQSALSIAASQVTGTKTNTFISDFDTHARGLVSVTGNGSYNSSTGVVTINNSPSLTFNYPTRSLNTAFQISTTQNAIVTYTVNVSCVMSLTSGQSGDVVLEYADDSGFTTNVKSFSNPTNANSGTLTLGLALTQVNGVTLHGIIPAGKYVRIRTVNNTGTPTFTYRNAQEVLM